MRLTIVFVLTALGGLFAPTFAHAHGRAVVSVAVAPLVISLPFGMIIVGYDACGRPEYGYPADRRAYGYYHMGVWYPYHAPRKAVVHHHVRHHHRHHTYVAHR